MRKNPFWRFLKPEDHLQYQVCQYITLQYPDVRYYHTPNEGKRSAFERFLISILGVKSGVPDLVVPVARHGYHGLYLELKTGTKKPTLNQKNWLSYLRDQGYRATWLNDFDKIRELLDWYLGSWALRSMGPFPKYLLRDAALPGTSLEVVQHKPDEVRKARYEFDTIHAGKYRYKFIREIE